jgi:hypothetical protein
MEQISGHTTTARRRGLVGLALGVLAVTATALVPVGSAQAAKPLPGSPMKPVAVMVGDTVVAIRGEAQLANACAPGAIYCHTYLAIMNRVGTKYQVHTWADISGLGGLQTIEVTPIPGKQRYRTAVHDFASFSTPTECGPSSQRIAGVRYHLFSCANGVSTYRKIFSSLPRTITAPLAV